MRKYLSDVKDKLVALKDGIAANLASWTGMPYTPSAVQTEIDKLDVIESEISNLASLLSSKQQAARELAKQLDSYGVGIENMVKSIHNNEKDKWVMYGVNERERNVKNPPSASLNLDIKDDHDGQGFILKIQKADSQADMYVWEKGVNDDPLNTTGVPQLVQFRESTKSEIVDDDVIAGKRYFYRVRAFNTKGFGNWSDVASRVQ